MEYFDASSTESAKPINLLLDDLRAGGATADLEARLAEVDDLVDRILADEAARPLEPEIVEALDRITGANDAPQHFRRVHERVERGATTWDQFWLRPHDEYRGFEIIQAAIVESTREVDAALSQLNAEEQRD